MEKKELKAVKRWRSRALFLFLLIFAAVFYQYAMHLMQRFEARKILHEAQNVRTIMRVVSVEYYARNTDIYDASTPSGLKPQAQEEILKLAECDGDIVILEHIPEELPPVKMLYSRGDYLVYFHLENGEERNWEVYRLDKALNVDGMPIRSDGEE